MNGAPRGLMISRGRVIVGLERRVEARRQNVGAHHHARPAARRRVVDRAVAAEPVLADVARLERPKPARQRVAGEAEAERAGEHLGEQGEDGGGEHMAFSEATTPSPRLRGEGGGEGPGD